MDDPPPGRITDHLPLLRRYARALARDHDDAEDLLQDALVHAYERRKSLRKTGSLRSWLMAIVHNTFVTDWRRRQHAARQTAVLDEAREAIVQPGQEHTVRLAQLQRTMQSLPAEQREALHLVVAEGLSYQEAAKVMAVPMGTLMSRLGRARAALRRMEEPASDPASLRSAIRTRLKVVGANDEAD